MAAIGALVLGAWAVRTYHLGAQSLWLDEGYTYDVARRGVRGMFVLLAGEDRHPPLHYVLVWAVMHLAGTSEYALRLPSALAGTLTVAIVHRLGRDLGGARLGFAAAALVAASPFLVWYSQEARMYALLAAFATASFWLWLRLVRGGGPAVASGYVLATAGALYSHYYAAFVLPGELLVLALLGRAERGEEPCSTVGPGTSTAPAQAEVPCPPARRNFRAVLAMAAAILAFAPWLPAVAQQAGRGASGYQPDSSLPRVLAGLAAAYPLGDSFPQPGWLVALFVVLAVLGTAAGPGQRWVGAVLLGWCLLAPLAAYALSVYAGVELRATGRMYYLAGAPAYLVLVARGVLSLAGPGPRRVLAVLLGIGLLGAQGWALREQLLYRAKEDWRGAARLVEARAWPGDAVLWVSEPLFRQEPFRYYYRGDDSVLTVDPRAPDLDAALGAAATQHQRLWLLLVHGQIADPNNLVETWLDQRLTPLADFPHPDVHLRLYSTEPRPNREPPAVERPIGAVLGGAVELVGVGGERDGGERGVLRVEVVWRALRSLADSYHAALTLADSGGVVRAQTDRVALSEFYDTTHWQPGEYLTDRYDLPLPGGLAPGGYRLRLHLYAPTTGRSLLLPGGGDLVDLGAVRVGPRRFDVPRMTRAVGARLGDAVELLGYDLPRGGELSPGETLTIRLWWRALRSLPRDYTVFTHLVGEDGTLRGQHDGPPVGGGYPTTLWAPGEVVGDEHELRLDPNAPPIQHWLDVGLYLPDTGQRLGDAIRLPTPIRVSPAGT
ncbi:MAG TPA: glycosyltransferase family 39 protein [Chloroflexota bacterium]|nr:glycosyltransferase family 39 protein [Chloroflexota bacterium]